MNKPVLQKELGITEPVWMISSEEEKLIWRTFIALLSFTVNFLIGQSSLEWVNLVTSLTVTAYVVFVVNTERSYSKFKAITKSKLLTLSWLPPVIMFIGIVGSFVVFLIYIITHILIESQQEQLAFNYTEEVISIITVIIIVVASKNFLFKDQLFRTMYLELSIVLIQLFSKNGQMSKFSFCIFELGVVAISSGLAYTVFQLADYIFLYFSI